MYKGLKNSFGDQFELILVNDGSRDESVSRLVAKLQSESITDVKVLGYPVNQGRGRALKTGIDAATGSIIVTTEVDGSWGDDIVERLVAELENNPSYDFVVASPNRPQGGFVNVTAQRIFLSRFGNKLIRQFFDSQVTMNTGMTRAYRPEVIQPLVAMENGKEFHLEVLLKLLALNFRVGEIPAVLTWQTHRLARDPNHNRKSSTRIRRTILTHLRFLVMAQPVRHFAVLAGLLGLGGTAFIIAAVFRLLVGEPSGLFAIVGLNLWMVGLVLTGFSVTLYQIRAMMVEAWMEYYPRPHPPAARLGQTLYPQPTEQD